MAEGGTTFACQSAEGPVDRRPGDLKQLYEIRH